MNFDSLVTLIYCATDSNNARYHEAVEVVNSKMETQDVEFFGTLIQAVLSDSEPAFRMQVAIAARKFLTSKNSCVQVLRAQVWRSGIEDNDKEEIIGSLFERFSEQNNQVPQLMAAIVYSSELEKGNAILDYILSTSLKTDNQTVKQSAVLCALHLYQHSKIYFCDQVVGFVTDMLQKPSSLWIVPLLQLLVLTVPLMQVPEVIVQELMRLLQAVLTSKNLKAICLVFNIFEKAVDSCDLMALKFEDEYVVKILLDVAVTQGDSQLTFSILAFLDKIFTSQATKDVYKTEYPFVCLELMIIPQMIQLQQIENFEEYIQINSQFELLFKNIMQNQDKTFQQQFNSYFMQLDGVKNILNKSGQLYSVLNDPWLSLILQLLKFTDNHSSTLFQLLLELLNQEMPPILTHNFVNCLLQTTQFFGFQQQTQQYRFCKKLLSHNLNLNTKELILNCIQKMSAQIFVNEFDDLLALLGPEFEFSEFLGTFWDDFFQKSPSMDHLETLLEFSQENALVKAKTVSSFIFQKAKTFSNSISYQDQLVYQKCEVRLRENVFSLLENYHFSLDTLIIANLEAYSYLQTMEQNCPLEFADLLLNFWESLPANEVFIAVCEFFIQFTNLTEEQTAKIVEICMRNLYVASNAQPQAAIAAVLKNLVGQLSPELINDILTYLQGVLDNLTYINMDLQNDFVLVLNCAGLAHEIAERDNQFNNLSSGLAFAVLKAFPGQKDPLFGNSFLEVLRMLQGEDLREQRELIVGQCQYYVQELEVSRQIAMFMQEVGL